MDDAVAESDFRAGGHSRDNLTSEIRKGEGIGQKARSPAASHASQGETTGKRGRRFPLPKDAQRQQPARGSAGGRDLDFAKQNVLRVVSDLGDVCDPCWGKTGARSKSTAEARPHGT